MPVTVKSKLPGLYIAIQRMEGPEPRLRLRPYMEAIGRLAVNELIARAPVGDTEHPGKSRDEPGHIAIKEGMSYDITGHSDGYTVTVKGPPQAKYVIEGTKKHPIPLERLDHRLFFFWTKYGYYVAPWMVNHPGTEPNLFNVRARAAIQGRVQDLFNQYKIDVLITPFRNFTRDIGG